jgi:hypothetical protein
VLCYRNLGRGIAVRDQIRERLTEYRTEALEGIGTTVNRTKSKASETGRTNSHAYYRAINEDNKAGFAQYMDRSADYICQVAPGSGAEYADELRDGGNKLKQEIMAKIDHDLTPSRHSAGSQFRTELRAALDKLIKHKVEDFEFDIMEANDVTPTIQNTVSITNSTNPNLVVQSTQSGNAISRDTALKLLELVNSDEIKELPENDRLEVLDQVTDIVKELNAPTTDEDKVHRGLERLGEFLSQVASNTVAETVAQAAIAYATFYIDQESSTRLKQ